MSHSKTDNQTDRGEHRDDDVAPILPDEAMDEGVDDIREDAAEVVEETIELSAEAADFVAQLEAERDEAAAARLRILADMANMEKRARREQDRACQEGSVRVVASLLAVLDNFDRALEQDPGQVTAEQYIDGIRLVHGELLKALEMQGLERIVPEIGVPFDPERHQAMFRQKTKGAAPNAVVVVLQPGYALGATVLRPAKVAVSQDSE